MGTYVHKGQIESRVKEWGYLAETGDRECRRLANEGLIERKEWKGSVTYKAYEKNTTKISQRDGSRSILPEMLHNGTDEQRDKDRLAPQLDLWRATG